jgi:hypothetical protein
MLSMCFGSFAAASLYFPAGARSRAMGNTGFALSDDETSLYHNPAGLGLRNSRFNGGSLSWFFSHYLFDFSNSYSALEYQNDRIPGLGFSSYVNGFNYGRIDEVAIGQDGQPYNTGVTWHNYEFTVAAGAGYCFLSNRSVDNSMGISIKYFREAMDNSAGTGGSAGSTFATDIGYLLQVMKRVRLGIVLRNIGPDIAYKGNGTSNNTQKLPVNLAWGAGYKESFDYGKLKLLGISSETSLSTLFNMDNYNPDSKPQNDLHTGVEICIVKTFYPRLGYSVYLPDNTRQITWGMGFGMFNHFQLDLFWVHYDRSAVWDSPVFGFAVSFDRILNWRSADRKWWLADWK